MTAIYGFTKFRYTIWCLKTDKEISGESPAPLDIAMICPYCKLGFDDLSLL
jgi:hypothetical protein